jgi:bifunctional non-homologous end joining protein LigD
MKWDGQRAIAGIGDGSDGPAVMVFSRTGREISAGYPELQAMARAAAGHDIVLDGEIVALGADGWPSFEALQQRMNQSAAEASRLAAQIPCTYLAFDLLFHDGERLTGEPYAARRARLEALGFDGPRWQTPPAFSDLAGEQVQALSRQHGLEGVMAKRLGSRYEPGRRSAAWRKIKNIRRQEFVVGGWKPGSGARTGHIGSLLVGVHSALGLVYAGHVGTGFTAETLRMLEARLAPLRRPDPPFADEIPREVSRLAVWVEPVLVVEVAFREWTTAGRLRAPAYLGVRTDKDPAAVVRE